ncbi:MAG: FAD-binding oxidoreductase [Candidatus Eremiobacteraeota bacterium]|nr:FAD-binding oxidoreductase [Candidatus Eremiobacteraeota bacterium]
MNPSPRCSALIVGAGIVGCCTAYRLAQQGVGDVVIIDKADAASGPTGRSSGIIRQFYTDPTLVQMARQGLHEYAASLKTFGHDAGFVRTGWLLTVDARSEPIARKGLDVQRPLGVPSRWLSVDEMRALVPEIAVGDLVGGIYEDDSGYGDPPGAATAFLSAARELGVSYHPHTAVARFVRRGDRIAGVETANGTIVEAELIFNCAGSWVPQLLAPLGYATPVSTSRHQIVTLRERPRPKRPIVSDPVNLVYIRPEGNDLTLIGSNDPADSLDHVDVERCPEYAEDAKIETMVTNASRRLPQLEHAGIAHDWSGVYDVSTDGFPILGKLPGLDGIVIATGLSGHGFKLAPAIAEILSSYLSATVDPRAHLFRWTRFEEGEPIRSTTTSSLTTMAAAGTQ